MHASKPAPATRGRFSLMPPVKGITENFKLITFRPSSNHANVRLRIRSVLHHLPETLWGATDEIADLLQAPAERFLADRPNVFHSLGALTARDRVCIGCEGHEPFVFVFETSFKPRPRDAKPVYVRVSYSAHDVDSSTQDVFSALYMCDIEARSGINDHGEEDWRLRKPVTRWSPDGMVHHTWKYMSEMDAAKFERRIKDLFKEYRIPSGSTARVEP